MKILVLSDSHGGIDAMHRAVEAVQPHRILFLGDGLYDAEKLQRDYPDIPMETVPGNCDHGASGESEKLIEVNNIRIFMLHGHTRNVKYDPMRAIYAAREYGAQILLFGHTHRASVDYDGTLYVMNPGTIGDRTKASYGVITMENNRLDCSVFRLE